MENTQNMFNREGGGNGSGCKCMHHKVVPVLIILFGLNFLLGGLGVLSANAVDIVWPVIVVLIGFMKLMKGACKCC